MPDITLTDKASDAENILNGVLGLSQTSSVEPAPMGWVIYFELAGRAAEALGTMALKLEHSCDESVRAGAGEPWQSDPEVVEKILRRLPQKKVDEVRILKNGELCIQWEGALSLRLQPAEYSLDWQWQVVPLQDAASQFSVVSVHGGKVFTRYPSGLLS
jgi:hypothetical protein